MQVQLRSGVTANVDPKEFSNKKTEEFCKKLAGRDGKADALKLKKFGKVSFKAQCLLKFWFEVWSKDYVGWTCAQIYPFWKKYSPSGLKYILPPRV